MRSERVCRVCLLLALPLVHGACAGSQPWYPFRAPVVRDQDLTASQLDCAKPALAQACAPESYESSFAWDAADNTIFRPVTKFLQADAVGEAENVNALDEVPDSSWFTNRWKGGELSVEQVQRGYCAEGPELPDDPAPGAFFIDAGKNNGANPGFRVRYAGAKYMFKTDDTQPERATAATVIASRLYYAAGFWAPCDSIVYFSRSALHLKPGLTVTANVGPTRALDEPALAKILAAASRRGELYRAAASRWLPGAALGPFKYEGTRASDPADVVAHENRRDLRGARLIAAWLNHFDSREQNSMDTWLPAEAGRPRGPGLVRHWYIDFGDCFGSEWTIDGFSRQNGHAYTLDFGYVAADFATLGTISRPWDRARRRPGYEVFGYFSERDFDPEAWRGEYPNPAFMRMTEHDAAWAARIIARFRPEHVAAAVNAGRLSNPSHAAYLNRVLLQRQQVILQRYLGRLSPLSDVTPEPGRLCAVDLARRTQTFPSSSFHYRAQVARGLGEPAQARIDVLDDGRLCVDLPSAAYAQDPLPAGSLARYTVVQIDNGTGSGALVAHLYDLGRAEPMYLVGIERLER